MKFDAMNARVEMVINNDYSVIRVTTKKRGFVTLVRVETSDLKVEVDNLIDKCIGIRLGSRFETLGGITYKHRVYTKRNDEKSFSYKYEESNNGKLDIIHSGEIVIFTLYDKKNIESVAINVMDLKEKLYQLRDTLNNKSMYEWLH